MTPLVAYLVGFISGWMAIALSIMRHGPSRFDEHERLHQENEAQRTEILHLEAALKRSRSRLTDFGARP